MFTLFPSPSLRSTTSGLLIHPHSTNLWNSTVPTLSDVTGAQGTVTSMHSPPQDVARGRQQQQQQQRTETVELDRDAVTKLADQLDESNGTITERIVSCSDQVEPVVEDCSRTVVSRHDRTTLKFGIDRILVTDRVSSEETDQSTGPDATVTAASSRPGVAIVDNWRSMLPIWNDGRSPTGEHPFRRLSFRDSQNVGLVTSSLADPMLAAALHRYGQQQQQQQQINTSRISVSSSSPQQYFMHHVNRPQDCLSPGYSLFSSNVMGLRVASTQNNNSKKKRSWSRAVFSNLQRKGLEKRFEVQKYVTKPDRRQLAAMLGLTDAQVKVWFQNRRMKWRHQEEAKRSAKDEQTNRQHAPNKTRPNDVINTSLTGSSCSDDDIDDDDDDDFSSIDDVTSHDNQIKFAAAHRESNIVALVTPLGCQLSAHPGGRTFRKPASVMSVADILDLRKSTMDCLKSSPIISG